MENNRGYQYPPTNTQEEVVMAGSYTLVLGVGEQKDL
jgi:hypothetical protein